MSRETTEARFVQRATERDWKEHQGMCPQCSRAVRERKPGEVRQQGHQLRRELSEANRSLAWNRAQDKLPGPGQEMLL